jgi:hypothetical protein
MSKHEDVAKLVRAIGSLLVAHDTAVHGAALAELTAIWIVSHVAENPARGHAAHMRLLEIQTKYIRSAINLLEKLE